ncbi:unnamed protein product [Leptosia nina]|uniref:Secreted protein n=1 Tax=Leptosia nina TaxID=320188 RepID=A0AAV1J844_9NEOP
MALLRIAPWCVNVGAWLSRAVAPRAGVRSGGHFTRLESERDFSVGVRERAAHASAPRTSPRTTTLAACAVTVQSVHIWAGAS